MNVINQGHTLNSSVLAIEVGFMVYTGGGGGGGGGSVRLWASPSVYIIMVSLETSKQFCCHWSCSNRACLYMQYSWERVSKKDHQIAADIVPTHTEEKAPQTANEHIYFIFYVADKMLYY